MCTEAGLTLRPTSWLHSACSAPLSAALSLATQIRCPSSAPHPIPYTLPLPHTSPLTSPHSPSPHSNPPYPTLHILICGRVAWQCILTRCCMPQQVRVIKHNSCATQYVTLQKPGHAGVLACIVCSGMTLSVCWHHTSSVVQCKIQVDHPCRGYHVVGSIPVCFSIILVTNLQRN